MTTNLTPGDADRANAESPLQPSDVYSSMPNSMQADAALQPPRRNSLWVGVLLIVLGLLAAAVPVVSTIFVETWVALILISAGAAKTVYAFQTRAEGGFVWKALLGLLYVATGVMLFIYPSTGILTLTLLLGSFLLMEGVFELILAFRLRPQQNWIWVLGNGIITLLLGGMIWFQWPLNAPWVMGTLIGFSILFSGISRVMLSLNPPRGLDQASA